MRLPAAPKPRLGSAPGPTIGLRVIGFWLFILLIVSVGRAGTPIDARIEVFPSVIDLAHGATHQQIVVTAIDSQKQYRDATRRSRFAVEPPEIARISSQGVVTPSSAGDGVLIVDAEGLQKRVSLHVAAPAHRPSSYRTDVVALLSKGGCNMGACHGNLNGKGGFRLSLRGEDPTFDLASLTRDSQGRRVNLFRPDASLAVLKPTGQVAHDGGLRFQHDSPESRTLLNWIALGAQDDLTIAPRLLRLDVFPRNRMNAASGLTQQLAITAEFSDGSKRDVTREASYDVSDPTKVSVSNEGLIEAKGPGETTVAVRYLTGRGVSSTGFLHDRPGFVWRAVEPRNALDTAVFAKLKLLKVNPAEQATDAVFLRRASLDATGRLPSAAEARAFLADDNPEKRSKLIGRLLSRPEFADFWALKWADLLRNEEKAMGEKGVWVFQRWLRDQIAADVPMTRFASQLLTAKGSTYASPPANFYRTNRDPMTAAETVSQVFLGASVSSAPAVTTILSTSGPRTITTGWPRISATSARKRSTSSAPISLTSTRLTATR